jgi:3-phytase
MVPAGMRTRLPLLGWFVLAVSLLAIAAAACGGSRRDARPPAPPIAPPPAAATACGRVDAARPFTLPVGRVTPSAETTPVPNRGDAADDAAIWIDPRDPERSVIIGTDKKGGLAVYDLSGRELQYRAGGRMNNVDIRCGFRAGGRTITLVAASDRRANAIALFAFDGRTRTLVELEPNAAEPDLDLYGLCLYRSGRDDGLYAIVTGEEGAVEQWRLEGTPAGVDAHRARRFELESQVEGCVADDRLGHLYVGEERVGIWKYGAEPDAGALSTLVDRTGNGYLVSDVEGLTLLYGPGDSGYLVASSQGDSSFAVYERAGKNRRVGRFRVVDGPRADAADDTDGIDGVAAGLGPAFPAGLLVVQDGDNDDGHQNFKLVPLRVED